MRSGPAEEPKRKPDSRLRRSPLCAVFPLQSRSQGEVPRFSSKDGAAITCNIATKRTRDQKPENAHHAPYRPPRPFRFHPKPRSRNATSAHNSLTPRSKNERPENARGGDNVFGNAKKATDVYKRSGKLFVALGAESRSFLSCRGRKVVRRAMCLWPSFHICALQLR